MTKQEMEKKRRAEERGSGTKPLVARRMKLTPAPATPWPAMMAWLKISGSWLLNPNTDGCRMLVLTPMRNTHTAGAPSATPLCTR